MEFGVVALDYVKSELNLVNYLTKSLYKGSKVNTLRRVERMPKAKGKSNGNFTYVIGDPMKNVLKG